ncbi:MAG: ABC transporter permease [Azospirillaceae bacterium]
MLSFLARRFLTLLLTALAASLVIFLVLEILPGDPALVQLGVEADPAAVERLREQLGLNQPAPLRYLAWLGQIVSFDLGESYAYRIPVAGLIAERFAVTLPLALLSLGLSTAIAIPLGMFAAARRNRVGDYGVMTFSQIGMAIPNFWIGILLIIAFTVHRSWISTNFVGWDQSFWGSLEALLLPAVALATTEAAILARVVRSAVLETMREDYVRTARAKGLSGRQVMFRHVLRNALVPIATIVGLQFAFTIAGSIVIEQVFTLPGLGRLLIQSIGGRDLIVIKNVVVLIAIMVVMVNFLVDALYAAIDPRPKD